MAANIRFKNRMLVLMLLAGITGSAFIGQRLDEVERFNRALVSGGKPSSNVFKFESKFAAAYATAKSGRFQDASQLFGQLMEMPASNRQLAAVQYNLGNIYLLRGLLVKHNGDEVKDEAEYLINQARLAYLQSLRLDNSHIDARHNLDRVLRLLPENPATEDEQDKLGVVMGSIPTGLP